MSTVEKDESGLHRLDLFKFNPLSTMEHYFKNHSTWVSVLTSIGVWVFSILYLILLVSTANTFVFYQELIYPKTYDQEYTFKEIAAFGLFDRSYVLIQDSDYISYKVESCESDSREDLATCSEISSTICDTYTNESICLDQEVTLAGTSTSGIKFVKLSILCSTACPLNTDSIFDNSSILFESETISAPDWALDMVAPKLVQFRYYPVHNQAQTVRVYYRPTTIRKRGYFSTFSPQVETVMLFDHQSIEYGQYDDPQVLIEIILRVDPVELVENLTEISVNEILFRFAGMISFLVAIGMISWTYNSFDFRKNGKLVWAGVPQSFSKNLMGTLLRNHFHYPHQSKKFCTICGTDQKTRLNLSRHIAKEHPEHAGKNKDLMCQYCVIHLLNHSMKTEEGKNNIEERIQKVRRRIEKLEKKLVEKHSIQ